MSERESPLLRVTLYSTSVRALVIGACDEAEELYKEACTQHVAAADSFFQAFPFDAP